MTKMGWIRTNTCPFHEPLCQRPVSPSFLPCHNFQRSRSVRGSPVWKLGASGWISSYQRLRGVLYLCIIPLYHTRITRGEFILIPNSTRSIAFVSTWSHPCFPLIPTSQCQTTILRQRTRVGLGGEATTWHEDRPDVSPNYLEVG